MASSLALQAPFAVHPPDDVVADGLRGRFQAQEARDQKWTSTVKVSEQADDVMDDQDGFRPDITYMPRLDNYEGRVSRLAAARSEQDQANESLPAGFPRQATGARCWSRLDGVKPEDMLVELSKEDVAEVETALAHFKDLPGENGPDQMGKALFPLPTLGPRLEAMARDIHVGRGIVFLRGFNPEHYSEVDNVFLYLGVSSYFGERRGCQDGMGNMIVHLVDFKSVFGEDGTRPDSFRANEMPFHTDVGDLLCMYVQDIAPNGGESTFASAAAVYNEIAASRPDVIDVLAKSDWYYDVTEAPLGDDWPHRALLFNDPQHGPFFIISRRKLTGADDFKLSRNLPAMSEEQAEAIDMVHFVAKKHAIAFQAQPGDMIFCNNLNLLHARNEYSQADDSQHKRHLLRLWLRNEELAWTTPRGLENDWFKVYGDSARRADAFWAIRAKDINTKRVLSHKLTCWN